jgi:hypothetical protein
LTATTSASEGGIINTIANIAVDIVMLCLILTVVYLVLCYFRAGTIKGYTKTGRYYYSEEHDE